MILLDRLSASEDAWRKSAAIVRSEGTILRVHQDVVDLALELVVRDREKLLAHPETFFMPNEICWFEWPMGEGDAGIFFGGDDVRTGTGMYLMWRYGENEEPVGWPFKMDLENGKIDLVTEGTGIQDPMLAIQTFATVKPVILAFLALINSPKMVKRIPAKVDRLNRKRLAAGKYTYHPHHTVRLNVDRKKFVVQEGHGGDGASRALHFVRAHLRLWKGTYILVSPHWRGDPQVGIRSTSYEIDRQHSRWAD